MDVTDLLIIEKELEKMNEKLQTLIDLQIETNNRLRAIEYSIQ